ncbi:MAG: hypothetical protein HYY11_02950 [Candidatus Methylomirabilis oxyfera]|nr:hypothetical protein [Candidatus Methylomirabilis oxyfera]
MKKAALYEEARQLYVEQGMTLADVGKSLQVSPTTLVAWKKDGDWEADRRAYLVERGCLRDVLRKIVRKLAEHVLDELNRGECDPQRIHALRSALTGLALEPSRIEAPAVVEEVASAAKASGLTDEVVATIKESILGVKA